MAGDLQRTTDLEQVTDYTSLLDFMRAVAIRFTANYEAVNAAIALTQSDLRAHKQVYERLKIHAEYLLSIPNQLGQAGVLLLTADERSELFRSVGLATHALSAAGDEGHYDAGAIWSILIMGRQDGIKGTLFERIVERLEAEEAPRVLRRLHVQALDALLTRPDIVARGSHGGAQLLLEAGVTMQPDRLFVYRWQWPIALEHALELLALGLPSRKTSPGAFLYDLDFRATLED